MFKKVILSHLGEVTQDFRTVGDTIRYRIYYGSTRASLTNHEMIISDDVDARLENIQVFNDGVFDAASRTITWTVPARRLKKAYVEFEAIAAKPGSISNQASARSAGLRPVKTNTVQVTVVESPPLGWMPFLPDVQDGESPRSYMKDETTSGITVRFDIPGLFIHEEKVGGVTYQHVSIPARAGMTSVGKPELPIVGEIIEVPFDVDFYPEIVKAETAQISGYNVYPAQEPRRDRIIRGGPVNPIENPIGPLRPPVIRFEPKSTFKVDAATYQANADFPDTPVSITTEDIGVIRGHRVLLLKVNPVLYNPAARLLTVYRTLEVRIHFDHPAQVKGVNDRIRSRAFEEFLDAALLNYKNPGRFWCEGGGMGDNKPPACDYLIITHDAFYNESVATNPVLRLANWKRQKGYRTTVVKVGTIGNTAAAIQAYIQRAYDNWAPPPSYILLIGDADLVRAVDGAHHPDEHWAPSPQPQIETDLYYTTVDGTDYFPDIFIGRMSADTLQQVTDMVDKVIAYEQTPPATPANAAFYTNLSLTGLFSETDEDPDVITGQEDRPWIANMETIRNFMQNQGYTVERIYATDTGFPGNAAAQDPRRYNDGTNLPNNLLHPQYAWNGGTNLISNAFNAGRFLMTYRAHGNWGGWAGPGFGIADAQALAQNDLLPLVICITCQAGWFDNETDDNTHGGRAVGDDCFAEVLLRRPRSGAIGVISMTRNSATGWNDFLVFGAYKAVWPTFNPDPPWAGHPAVPTGDQVELRRLGQISSFSKMYMARAYAAGNQRLIEFEMHHLFGDPELPLWTAAPRDLTAEYPKGIGAAGLQEFVVKVTDTANGQIVHNAVVALTRNNTLIQMQQTHTNGLARFSLTDAGSGDMDLTVTALGYRPHLGKLEVTSTGAELNILDPDDGPEGQVIHIGGRNFKNGENVEITFGTAAPFTTPANASGEFGQGVPTVDFTVPAGYAHGLVNIYACGATSHRKAVRIFQVRDKNPVDLWIYDQWNSNTWTLHPGDNPTWNNPDIQLYDSNNNPVDSGNLVLGQVYKVRVTVRNSAGYAAPNASVVYQWENYGAGGPWQNLATVPVNVPANPPGLATAETNFQPVVTGHVCIQVNIEHLEDIDTTNNTGQENLHIGYSSSPAEACFTVWNQTKEPAPVHFEVRQLFNPDDPQKILWASRVKHPDPQFIKPGDQAEACVIIDPDKIDVPKGTKAEFAVTCFIGKVMIGGVNLIIIKK